MTVSPFNEDRVRSMLDHPAELLEAHRRLTGAPQAAVGLGPGQRKCFEVIRGYLAEHGCSPSYNDIAAALNLRSKSGVHRLVSALEERGFVRRMPGRMRSLVLICELPEARARR